MCRAVKVLCVATDDEALRALRHATTAAEWELTPGATDETDALGVIDAERPHAMVVFGGFERLVVARPRTVPGDADRDGSGRARDERRGLPHAMMCGRSSARSARPGGPIVEGSGAQPPQGSQP